MAGLTRKKIKVRSKKGKTYMRSVMVKQQDPMTLGRFMRKHGAKYVGLNMAVGSGMGVGAAVGYHATHSPNGMAGGAGIGHIATSLGTAMFLRKHKEMHKELERDMRAVRNHRAIAALAGIGAASQIAGTVLGGAATHGVAVRWHR